MAGWTDIGDIWNTFKELDIRRLAEEAKRSIVLAFVGVGFLWRQIARQIVGLIPIWGIAPKVAVAYAGTYAVGEAILYWYQTGHKMSGRGMGDLYANAFARGKQIAQEIVTHAPKASLPQVTVPTLPRPAVPKLSRPALPRARKTCVRVVARGICAERNIALTAGWRCIFDFQFSTCDWAYSNRESGIENLK